MGIGAINEYLDASIEEIKTKVSAMFEEKNDSWNELNIMFIEEVTTL